MAENQTTTATADERRAAAARLGRIFTPGPFQTREGWAHALPPERREDIRAVLGLLAEQDAEALTWATRLADRDSMIDDVRVLVRAAINREDGDVDVDELCEALGMER